MKKCFCFVVVSIFMGFTDIREKKMHQYNGEHFFFKLDFL